MFDVALCGWHCPTQVNKKKQKEKNSIFNIFFSYLDWAQFHEFPKLIPICLRTNIPLIFVKKKYGNIPNKVLQLPDVIWKWHDVEAVPRTHSIFGGL